MDKLTITESYMLLVLNKKGRFSTFNNKENICLLISGILELLLYDFVCIDNGKFVIRNEVSNDFKYLKPLVNNIKDSKNNVSMNDFATKYIGSIKNKNLSEFFYAVGSSLIEKDYAKKIRKSSILGSKIGYLPYKKSIKQLIERITKNVLIKERMNNDYIVILSLINSCGHIDDHFSKIEKDRLKIILQDIQSKDKYIKVKEMFKCIDDIVELMIKCSVL